MAGTSYRELVEDALQSLSDRRDTILELADASEPDEERLLGEGLGAVVDFGRVIGYGALAIADAGLAIVDRLPRS